MEIVITDGVHSYDTGCERKANISIFLTKMKCCPEDLKY
jgi:hypothetical protein